MKRFCLGSLLAATLFSLPVLSASAFGGEDIMLGDPWHHEQLSCWATAGSEACGDEALYPGTGFSIKAADAVSWHADYIDSYLYSPLWWASPIRPLEILDRYKASRSNFWQLASLHFDDLTSTEGIEYTWRRYMAGTLIGLEWAAENDDIAAAHNILGVSLHAVQDFYSHSTWIDAPPMRQYTYLQVPPERRSRFTLSTGAYERTHSPVQHGKYNFHCSAYTSTFTSVANAFEKICRGPDILSPLAAMDFCAKARECQGSRQAEATIEIFGRDGEIAVLAPPGIAMDTTWLARIGAEQRGLTGPDGLLTRDRAPSNSDIQVKLPGNVQRQVTGHSHISSRVRNDLKTRAASQARISASVQSDIVDYALMRNIKPREVCSKLTGREEACDRESDYLFAETKHLAATASHQWIELIDDYMFNHTSKNTRDFWLKVKTCPGNTCVPINSRKRPPRAITAAFEDYSSFPFQFLTAGHDKPTPPANSEGWYLRVALETSEIHGAGTDADIYLEADGKRILLDYLNAEDPASKIRSSLLVYNDFEAGDHQVYTVGPFSRLPSDIALINDSTSTKENWRAFRRAFRQKMRGAWDTFAYTFRNLQDYIGPIDEIYTTEQLDHIIDHGISPRGEPREPGVARIRVNGGPEGIYDFFFNIRKTNWRGQGAQHSWSEYEIGIPSVYCVDESNRDGGSNADEPYFFLALGSYGIDEPQTARFGPYDKIGVDRRQGNVRWMWPDHKFKPVHLPRNGAISLSGQMYEHDNERASERDDLYQKFVTSTDPSELEDYNQFVHSWGKTLGGDWHIKRLKIHAFRRSARPAYGLVFDQAVNVWINEEERRAFNLNTRGVRTLDVAIDQLKAKPAPLNLSTFVTPPVMVFPKAEPTPPAKPVAKQKSIELKRRLPVRKLPGDK